MTSDSTPPEGPAGTPGQPANETSAVDNAMADAKAAFEKAGFSTPEGMVALGGIIILLGWLIFDFFMSDFGPNDVALILSVAVVLLFFDKAGLLEKLAPRPAITKILGYAIALFGLIQLLYVLRYASSYNTAGEIIGAIVIFAGYAIAFLGARSIKA